MSPRLRLLLRRTWIPLSLAALLVAGVLVAMPWYYKTYRGATPDRGLTAGEIDWARAYAPWRSHVRDVLARAHANRNSVDGELGRILEEIAGCGEGLWLEIGTPPSERLDAVAQRAAAACAAADGAREEYRAAGDTPSWRTSARLAGANDSIRGAEFELRRLMLAQRALERRGGRDERASRVEPRLGEAISAEYPTEVLCWSEDEWPQVQEELAAVGLEQDQPLRRDVNAYRFRVHASPRVCDALVAFAYAEAPAADAEVAFALTAVLHAAQHAVARVQDEQEAECRAVRGVETAAVRLGAGPEAADELAGLARSSSGCP